MTKGKVQGAADARKRRRGLLAPSKLPREEREVVGNSLTKTDSVRHAQKVAEKLLKEGNIVCSSKRATEIGELHLPGWYWSNSSRTNWGFCSRMGESRVGRKKEPKLIACRKERKTHRVRKEGKLHCAAMSSAIGEIVFRRAAASVLGRGKKHLPV